jgi:Tfp pilus assembly protein PilX
MTTRTRIIVHRHNERGIALPLTLMILMILAGIGIAFMSVSTTESRVARNHSEAMRVRYVADAGIDWAFNRLVTDMNWSALLNGATCAVGTTGVSPAGWSAVTLPGLPASEGTFTVTIRNDCQAGDDRMTREPVEAQADSGTVDRNDIVILTATGTLGRASRAIQVVMRRSRVPSFQGAVSQPGMQSDTFVANSGSDDDEDDDPAWSIDGRDYDRDGRRNNANPEKFGMAVQPGIQANLGITYERNAENGFNSNGKRNAIRGRAQASGSGKGWNTIAPDGTVNPTVMGKFLSELASNPATTVLQSTMACPMVLTGGSSSPTNQPTLTNGCGLTQTLDLGTVQNPRLVYFRGDLDTSSRFTGLRVEREIQGAGILVVEDGDLRVLGNIRWDGVIMVVGRYVGAGFMPGSNITLYGSFVSMETVGAEANGFYEFYLGSNTGRFRYSRQNMEMVQTVPGLHTLYGWREI